MAWIDRLTCLFLRYRVRRLSPRPGDLLVLECSERIKPADQQRLADALGDVCEHHDCRGLVTGPGFNLKHEDNAA